MDHEVGPVRERRLALGRGLGGHQRCTDHDIAQQFRGYLFESGYWERQYIRRAATVSPGGIQGRTFLNTDDAHGDCHLRPAIGQGMGWGMGQGDSTLGPPLDLGSARRTSISIDALY